MSEDRVQEGLRKALNRASAENASDTPDYILAKYLGDCLDAFNSACNQRAEYYDTGSPDHPREDVYARVVRELSVAMGVEPIAPIEGLNSGSARRPSTRRGRPARWSRRSGR